MTSSLRPPQYRRHKARDKGYVRHRGKMIYFPGPWDSAESQAAYDAFVERWRRDNDPGRYGRTIAELAAAYIDWANDYYMRDGEPTGYAGAQASQLKLLLAQHRHTLICEFGPKALAEFRDSLDGKLDRRCKHKRKLLTRQGINRILRTILEMVRFGVEAELVTGKQHDELRKVRKLEQGHCKAPEAPAVIAVDDAHVDAALPYMRPQVRAMCELMRLTGMRPGEATMMRPCDVTFRTDRTAVYRPARHKLTHRKIERRIFLGPKALEILRPWLDRPAEQFCFQPREALASLRAELRAKRQTRVQPSQFDRRKEQPVIQPRDRYDKDSFTRAVKRACIKAEVPVWRPNQLRHRVAGLLQEKYDRETAGAALGHLDPRTTGRYSGLDFERAAKAMLEVG